MRKKQLRVGDRVIQIKTDNNIAKGTRGILMEYHRNHTKPYYWRVRYDCTKFDGNSVEYMASRDELDFVRR